MDDPLSLFSEDDGCVTREQRRRTEAVRVGPALARTTDPATSKRAATRQRLSGIPAAVLEVFDTLDVGGLTDDQLCDRLRGYLPASVKTARSRLSSTKKGRVPFLEDSGARSPSDNGHDMVVWRRIR